MSRLCLVIICLFSVNIVSPTIHGTVVKVDQGNLRATLTLGEPERNSINKKFMAEKAEEKDWGSIFNPGFFKIKQNTSILFYIDRDIELERSTYKFSDYPESTEFIVYYGFSWEGDASDNTENKKGWFGVSKNSSKKLNFYVRILDPKVVISQWAGLVIKPIAIPEEKKMALDIEVACGTFDETSKEVQPKGEVFAKGSDAETDKKMHKFSGNFNFDPDAKQITFFESNDTNNKTTFVDKNVTKFMRSTFSAKKFRLAK